MLCENGERYTCFIRGKIKWDFDVFVGDNVVLAEIKGNTGIIDKVLPRKNVLVRPYVANIDTLIIVVSPVPEPDFILVDKLIVNCYTQNITPLLCFHKSELITDSEIAKYIEPYRNQIRCIKTSSYDNKIGLKELFEEIKGKLVCFAGQSAMGKSSIINCLSGNKLMEVGELSEKIQRGKNTTRHIEIFDFDGFRVVDTCGFSLMELKEIKSDELNYYYDEYVKLSDKCQYHHCLHVKEQNCAVKQAVQNGDISKERYERYVDIYNELKEQEDKQYE